jgi:hypothetical protein
VELQPAQSAGLHRNRFHEAIFSLYRIAIYCDWNINLANLRIAAIIQLFGAP